MVILGEMRYTKGMSYRLAFMGTPLFAVPALQTLLQSPHEVVAVYSRPPAPQGRGHKLTPSPVHHCAEAAGVPVFTPKTLRDEAEQARFKALDLDLCVVAAYGLILPEPILAAPKAGCVNLHASLLPRWRGAAPIQRAILAGDTESGVCLMQMEKGLDTGGVFARVTVPITPTTTGPALQDALAAAGGQLLAAHLDDLASGKLTATPQPLDGITYAEKITKDEAAINWQQTATEIDRQVRAFTPWPSAICTQLGEPIKVLEAEIMPTTTTAPPSTVLDDQFSVACGGGTVLRLLKVQRAGRGAVSGAECLRGMQPTS